MLSGIRPAAPRLNRGVQCDRGVMGHVGHVGCYGIAVGGVGVGVLGLLGLEPDLSSLVSSSVPPWLGPAPSSVVGRG